MKKAGFLVLLWLVSVHSYAQDALFGVDSSRTTNHGLIINANFSGDIPAADMAKRFGDDFRIGGAITYKTKKNWIFGAKCDFIVGNKIKEDSLMINIKDKYSGPFNGKLVELINNNGNRVGVPVYERGYMIALQAGKIINFNKEHPDDGLMLLTSAGFIQHKINIYNSNKDVPALWGDMLKGYDRLTNGWFIEQYAGYCYFAKNKLLNFNIGLDAMLGFTKDRRDYLFDVMRTDNKQRYDVLFGIRAGWMIPIFRHSSEEISFE